MQSNSIVQYSHIFGGKYNLATITDSRNEILEACTGKTNVMFFFFFLKGRVGQGLDVRLMNQCVHVQFWKFETVSNKNITVILSGTVQF